MSCAHSDGSGNCRLGLHGGRPSRGVCSVCESYDGPARGLGDVVHSVAVAMGVAPIAKAIFDYADINCGCPQRRAALNEAVPFTDEAPKD